MNNGTRKGGQPEAMKVIYSAPGLEDLGERAGGEGLSHLVPEGSPTDLAQIEVHVLRVSGASKEEAKVDAPFENECPWIGRSEKPFEEEEVKEFALGAIRKHVLIMYLC